MCFFKAVGTVGGLRGSSVNRSYCRRAERTLTLWVHKVIHQLHGTDGNRGLFNPFKPGVGFSWHSIHCWQWPRWNCQYQRAKGFKCVTQRTNWGEWWLDGGGVIAQIRLSHFTAASRDRKMHEVLIRCSKPQITYLLSHLNLEGWGSSRSEFVAFHVASTEGLWDFVVAEDPYWLEPSMFLAHSPFVQCPSPNSQPPGPFSLMRAVFWTECFLASKCKTCTESSHSWSC